jgi:MYXO-CTERM domain-containing protein
VSQSSHSCRVLSIICLGAALAGCSDETEPIPRQRVGTAPAAIAGGYQDNFDTSVVGVIHATQVGVGGCTGSLLSPNVVLTALHCVADTPQLIDCPSQIFGIHSAADMYVTTQATYPQSLNGWAGVREISQSPFNGLCGRDVAILILQNPISGAEATPLLPRLEPLAEGEVYSAVGYGQQGEGGPSGTRFRRDDLSLLCVGSMCGAPEFIYPKEWVGETGVCSGDSGGPALDAEGRVTGVASRGAEGCDQPVYGDVYGHRAWIKETTVYAAGLAGLTPPSWATEPEGTGGGGPGGNGGVGGGGVGGGASSSSGNGNGYYAGDYEDEDFDGDIVSSCAYSPTGRSSGWMLALLGLVLARARRRKR